MLNITKLNIIYCNSQFIMQLSASGINFETMVLTTYYKNKEIM